MAKFKIRLEIKTWGWATIEADSEDEADTIAGRMVRDDVWDADDHDQLSLNMTLNDISEIEPA